MFRLLVYGIVTLTMGAEAWAAGNNELHQPPFTFLFGNHIDTHQETRLNKDGTLRGQFYVYYTGAIDEVSGLPVARHPRGPEHDEECGVDPIDCVIGWELLATPAEAKFISHSGVHGDDHPVWLIGNRSEIPQPGSFTHFHWITSASTDERYDTVPAPCDVAMAGMLEGTALTGELTLDDGVQLVTWEGVDVHVEDGAENLVCPGWLFQLTARRSFAFQHGGENTPVRPGTDNSTHVNIVANYALVPAMTGDRDGH